MCGLNDEYSSFRKRKPESESFLGVRLFELVKRIIIHLGHAFLDEEIRLGYDFGRKHQYLASLERLVDKATRP